MEKNWSNYEIECIQHNNNVSKEKHDSNYFIPFVLSVCLAEVPVGLESMISMEWVFFCFVISMISVWHSMNECATTYLHSSIEQDDMAENHLGRWRERGDSSCFVQMTIECLSLSIDFYVTHSSMCLVFCTIRMEGTVTRRKTFLKQLLLMTWYWRQTYTKRSEIEKGRVRKLSGEHWKQRRRKIRRGRKRKHDGGRRRISRSRKKLRRRSVRGKNLREIVKFGHDRTLYMEILNEFMNQWSFFQSEQVNYAYSSSFFTFPPLSFLIFYHLRRPMLVVSVVDVPLALQPLPQVNSLFDSELLFTLPPRIPLQHIVWHT